MAALDVLIIDDNRLNVELATEVLEVAGYATRAAFDADDGIRLARERVPDVILLDLRMPGKGGIEALRELRADSRTAGVPLVALTAQAMQGDQDAAIAAGFDGYIAKPINTQAFPAQVSAFSKRRPAQ